MILVGAHQISKSFSERPIFQNLTFSIDSGERIGLIGPNGSGKSTLLKIISGQIPTDGGSLTLSKELRLGFLQQVPKFKDEATIQTTIMEGSEDPYDWKEMSKAQELCSLLELNKWNEDTPISQLSGGWQKRVALARELLRQPNLLLLDEPTNHLDVEGILWLEDFLANSPFATLTITHDRLFLQKVANRIIEINRRYPDGLLSVRGTYADFLESRENILLAQLGQEQKLRNTLRRETEWLRRGAKARQTKQKARINSAHNLADKVDEVTYRNNDSQVRFDFQSTEKNPKILIEAKAISKSYDGNIVIPKIDLLIGPKSRIGLMGENGCGKSTLIKLLTKEELPDEGSIFHAEKLEVSYFEQNRQSLDPDLSLLKTLCPTGDHIEYAGTWIHARSYLSRFLFNQDQMDTPVYKLSGGEQSRLLLARLMLTKANLLVLDEPTNDLDMATLDVLAKVLQEFNGAILLVTHDRYFLDEMTNQILAFGIDSSGNKQITSMVGLDQWQMWHDKQLLFREKLQEVKNLKSNIKNDSTDSAKIVKKKSNSRLKQNLMIIENEIDQAETSLKETQHLLGSVPLADSQKIRELTTNMSSIQNQLDDLYEQWSAISESIEE